MDDGRTLGCMGCLGVIAVLFVIPAIIYGVIGWLLHAIHVYQL